MGPGGKAAFIGRIIGEFGDIQLAEGQELSDYYFKSECRPLKLVKPFHTRFRNTHKLTFRAWLEERDRARKDLYWLGHDCIGTEQSGSGFVEHVHREMCEAFVQKNFDGVYHADYTLTDVRRAIGRQSREKEMLLLCPRGSFKSTANKIDCVQWMLNAPDIRIFIVTGLRALSDKFLLEVKGFFYKPPSTAPTHFQQLFPEYILEGTDATSESELYCPARICRQEGNPSLWVNSIDSRLAGHHCDVMKGDDIVNEVNSNNEETRAKLKSRYDNASTNLPDEWAFRDQLGTRYYPDDWYGGRIAAFQLYPDTNRMKYICRAAWTVKPDYTGTPRRQLSAEMVDLYFPEKLDFASLMQKCRQNEQLFCCQQLNEPEAGNIVVHFDEDTIKSHLLILTRVPRPANGAPRMPVICWDTAHTASGESDYSAGAVGYCDREKRSLYVLEVCYGKWKDSDLAVQIVSLHRRWQALFTEIEKFAGWELMAAEIQRVAYRMNNGPIAVVWRDIDQTKNAKRNRVKGLETLLADDRLWFVDGEWMDATLRQFLRFNGVSKRRRDDIPDAISSLQKLIPPLLIVETRPNETEEQRKAREAQELRDGFAQQQREAEYRTVFQPAPLLIPDARYERPAESGPGRVFGNTGLHL